MKIQFNKWFKLQYGNLPMSDGKRYALRKKQAELRNALNGVELDLKSDEVQRIRYDAALKATQR